MGASFQSSLVPQDVERAILVGRVWRKTGGHEGPSVVVVRAGEVFDITASAPTTADLFERDDVVRFANSVAGESLGPVDALIASNQPGSEAPAVHLLAPCDLQAIKACGVTFAVSLIERVIEEQAGGDPAKAKEVRETIVATIGDDLSKIRPGSEAAQRPQG